MKLITNIEHRNGGNVFCCALTFVVALLPAVLPLTLLPQIGDVRMLSEREIQRKGNRQRNK
jgi:hypothetical protein